MKEIKLLGVWRVHHVFLLPFQNRKVEQKNENKRPPPPDTLTLNCGVVFFEIKIFFFLCEDQGVRFRRGKSWSANL